LKARGKSQDASAIDCETPRRNSTSITVSKSPAVAVNAVAEAVAVVTVVIEVAGHADVAILATGVTATGAIVDVAMAFNDAVIVVSEANTVVAVVAQAVGRVERQPLWSLATRMPSHPSARGRSKDRRHTFRKRRQEAMGGGRGHV
jgi:hypothetical protein